MKSQPVKSVENKSSKSVDILIVGGGLIGATLMLTLANKGYRLLLVDAHPLDQRTTSPFDSRSLALSPASTRILQMLDIWPTFQQETTPIQSIHVSEQFRFGATRLFAKENEPLGHVVEIQKVYQALSQQLATNHVLAPAQVIKIDTKQQEAVVETEKGQLTIRAKLIVAADGTHSLLRRFTQLGTETTHYNQQAITANIGLTRSHQNRAFERFTSTGSLAFLPLSENRAALVWVVTPEKASHLLQLKEDLFLAELQKDFGYKLGKLTKVGKRTSFPLQQVVMPKQVAWPFVFIGNAANTLHPIAGQGFNLGLRDVACLAQCILHYGLDEQMLVQYELMRKHDQKSIATLTNNLVQIFVSSFPGIGLIRNLGLLAIDLFPVLSNLLTHYAGGFGGELPDLVCKIPLPHEKKHASST